MRPVPANSLRLAEERSHVRGAVPHGLNGGAELCFRTAQRPAPALDFAPVLDRDLFAIRSRPWHRIFHREARPARRQEIAALRTGSAERDGSANGCTSSVRRSNLLTSRGCADRKRVLNRPVFQTGSWPRKRRAVLATTGERPIFAGDVPHRMRDTRDPSCPAAAIGEPPTAVRIRGRSPPSTGPAWVRI